jgi:hypothetical protein
MTTYFNTILETPVLSRIRRNHGLEHATIHILAKKGVHSAMAGHSDAGGFWLLGDLETAAVAAAVDEALARMQNGEHKLAVHPNCGTNFVTSGVFAGLAAGAAMLGARRLGDKLARLPLAISLATLALIFAQPFGFIVQERITTSGVPGALAIVEIFPTRRGRFKAHRIVTRG